MTNQDAMEKMKKLAPDVPGVTVGMHPSYRQGYEYHVGIRQASEWVVVGRGKDYEAAFADLIAVCHIILMNQEKIK